MNRRYRRRSAVAAGVSVLGAGVTFVLGATGWTSAIPSDEASALFGETELSVHIATSGKSAGAVALSSEFYGDAGVRSAADAQTARHAGGKLKPVAPTDEIVPGKVGRHRPQPSSPADLQRAEETASGRQDGQSGLAAGGPDQQLDLLIAEAGFEAVVQTEPVKIGNRPRSGGRPEDEPAPPGAGAAPGVEVRVGSHGEYERVVFEWPEAIAHEVVQRGDRVVVAFDRPGRFDLSPLRDGFGDRVIEARATGGEITDQVVLRVSPEARIRTLSLNDNRTVAIDIFGEEATQSVAAPAPAPNPDSVQALRDALEQRDAVIDNLLMRVEQLERKLALSSGELDMVRAGGTGAAGAVGTASLPRPMTEGTWVAQAPSSEPAPQPSESAQSAPSPTPASQNQAGGGANAAPKPGQFEVVEEEIDRALERTLVQTGVLLLPTGQAEVEPSFSYTRREGNIPVLFTENGTTSIAEQDVRRNEFESGQIVRVGLPFDSQFEVGLPYRYVDQSAVTKVGGVPVQERDGSGQGFGDVSVGVAKTLLQENGGWWPDLVARLTWDIDTGKTSDNDVLLGGGFNRLQGTLNAVKRQDPLAFIGAVSYGTTFENHDVKPGDELGVNIGTVLAASPSTSLRLGLGQRFVDNTRVDGEGIDGSDRVVGTATFGASVILGHGVLLDVAADIGLTDDAPDYALRTSLPIRFNLPAF